jgi:hypothetical protein
MGRQIKAGLVVIGSLLIILWLMPMSNSCLSVIDRAETPVQVPSPNDNPFGSVACDSFGPRAPGWLLVSGYIGIFIAIGALLARLSRSSQWLTAGAGAAVTLLLSFIAGKLIYPWLEVYWMPARELIVLMPVTFIFGVIGWCVVTSYLRVSQK